MFQKFISVLLLELFGFGLFYNSVIWIHYELNVKRITAEFCVNIDKPELNCNGKCHIKRKLIFDTKPDAEAPLQNPNYIPTQKNLKLDVSSIALANQASIFNKKYVLYYNTHWQPVLLMPPFHPPIVFCIILSLRANFKPF